MIRQLTPLEQLQHSDIPTKKLKQPIAFKQSVPTKEDYERQFNPEQPIEDIWDELYIYVYHKHTTNTQFLLFGPMYAIIRPARKLMLSRNKAIITTELPKVVDLTQPKKVDNEHYNGAKAYFQDNVINGDIPWVKGHPDAIRAQNDLNRVIALLAKTVPDLNGDSVELKPLCDVFNQLYTIAETVKEGERNT